MQILPLPFKYAVKGLGSSVKRPPQDKSPGSSVPETAWDLSVKTVTIDGDKDCEAAAVEILDDLGFSAVEV